MRADLHMHSVYSDGVCVPEILAMRAKRANVQLFSVTDHDSLGGEEEKRAVAQKYSLAYVSGWEVSSYEDCKVHVLGYRCKADSSYYDFLEERRQGGFLRAQDMLERANTFFGLSLTMDDIEREHLKKTAPLHTMHVVRAFAKKLSKKAGETYLQYFDVGKPIYSDLCRPTADTAIRAIHACGGIAVLAHPGRIKKEKQEKEELMDRLVREGLDGIECYYTTHTQSDTEYFVAYAQKHGLLVTGGSDFHADDDRHFIGKPEFHAESRLLDALLG